MRTPVSSCIHKQAIKTFNKWAPWCETKYKRKRHGHCGSSVKDLWGEGQDWWHWALNNTIITLISWQTWVALGVCSIGYSSPAQAHVSITRIIARTAKVTVANLQTLLYASFFLPFLSLGFLSIPVSFFFSLIWLLFCNFFFTLFHPLFSSPLFLCFFISSFFFICTCLFSYLMSFFNPLCLLSHLFSPPPCLFVSFFHHPVSYSPFISFIFYFW